MSGHLRRHDLRHPDGRTFFVYGDTIGTLDGQPADTGFDVSRLQRRYDRLRDEWVLISPARNKRPGGKIAVTVGEVCPLCPGGPELPWPYELAVFDNRFPSLHPTSPHPNHTAGHADYLANQSGAPTDGHFEEILVQSAGRCLVVVYTGQHEGSLAALPPAQFLSVLAVWRERTAALWAEGNDYVMAFENRGAAVGATLTHPHGQLYAFGHLPPFIRTKRAAHDLHRDRFDSCLGCTMLSEDKVGGRIVDSNASFVAAVPFAPHWPLEVQIRARRHGARRLGDLSDDELRDLAQILHQMLQRYDQVYGFDLPMMIAVQESPPAARASLSTSRADRTDSDATFPDPQGSPSSERSDPSAGASHPDWHLHIELLPPHRSEFQLKVRASVETVLGTFILDALPEDAAIHLAALPVSPIAWPSIPRIEPVLTPTHSGVEPP